MDATLARRLERLEQDLWTATRRADVAFMRAVLAPDFVEVGRSGRVYDRDACLGSRVGTFLATLPLPEYRLRELGADVFQATYISEFFVESGAAPERARRSSIWTLGPGGEPWLRHHQGTPI